MNGLALGDWKFSGSVCRVCGGEKDGEHTHVGVFLVDGHGRSEPLEGSTLLGGRQRDLVPVSQESPVDVADRAKLTWRRTLVPLGTPFARNTRIALPYGTEGGSNFHCASLSLTVTCWTSTWLESRMISCLSPSLSESSSRTTLPLKAFCPKSMSRLAEMCRVTKSW